MARFFPLKNLSLRRKLTLVIVAVSTTVTLLAGVLFFLFDSSKYRSNLEEEISTLAIVIGDNSTAAILFDDDAAGAEILSSLAAETRITAASLYRADGSLFSSYGKRLGTETVQIENDNSSFGDGLFHLSHIVSLGGEKVGSVYIETSLADLAAQQRRMVVILLLIFSGFSVVAFLLATRLQRIISEPVLNLTEAAERISTDKDYSLRADEQEDDELGQLSRSFNQMVSQIEKESSERFEALNALRKSNRELNDAQDASLNILEDLDVKQTELLKINEALERARETLELRVAQRTEELEKLHQDKDRFISRASHDLRTPVAAILGFSKLLLRGKWGELTEDQLLRMVRIDKQAERINKIVSDLLSISRIEAGVIGQAKEVIDLTAIINSVINEMTQIVNTKSQSLTFDGNGAVLTGIGDGDSVRQILTNLIDNASKYTPEEGSIAVSAESRNSRRVISVADDGIGMSNKDQDRVFDEFYRAQPEGEAKVQGTGLGLAIAKKLALQMEGNLTVYSAGAGEGCTFTLEIPAAEDNTMEA